MRHCTKPAHSSEPLASLESLLGTPRELLLSDAIWSVGFIVLTGTRARLEIR
jgi:hypothetical protein